MGLTCSKKNRAFCKNSKSVNYFLASMKDALYCLSFLKNVYDNGSFRIHSFTLFLFISISLIPVYLAHGYPFFSSPYHVPCTCHVPHPFTYHITPVMLSTGPHRHLYPAGYHRTRSGSEYSYAGKNGPLRGYCRPLLPVLR